MGKSINSRTIKDGCIRRYLEKHYPGTIIYIRKDGNGQTKSRGDVVNILRRAGLGNGEICRWMRMYPSTLTRLVRSSAVAPVVRRAYRRRNKRVYTKRNMAFWNKHPGKALATA